MKCMLCGKELAPGVKFCPNCGTQVVEQTPEAVPNVAQTVVVPEQTVNPYVSQTASQQNANPYYGNMPPYDPTLSPYAGMGVQQKKKKVWPWVLLACLIMFGNFVLLCVIVGILVGR